MALIDVGHLFRSLSRLCGFPSGGQNSVVLDQVLGEGGSGGWGVRRSAGFLPRFWVLGPPPVHGPRFQIHPTSLWM